MRRKALFGAALLTCGALMSAGLAQAGGSGGHASGHVAGAAHPGAANAHAAPNRDEAESARGARSWRPYYGGFVPGGHSAYRYGYEQRSTPYARSGSSYGFRPGFGFEAGYGLGGVLSTDTGGYDEEGSPQPYGGLGFIDGPYPPPPPALADTGYGRGYGDGQGYGPGLPALAEGVHDRGEGAYAYGYNGYAQTPVLPYGAGQYPPPYAYYPASQTYPGAMAYGYAPPGPACGC